jgi:hypothetical protein
MTAARLALAVASAAMCAVASPQADLKNVSRILKNEPVYQTKAPKYCLLAFGLEAEKRAWLVVDGDVLYVDRNGNADLREDGERMKVRTVNKELDSKVLLAGHSFVDLIDPQKTAFRTEDRDVPTLKGSARYTRFKVGYFTFDQSYIPESKEEKEKLKSLERNWKGFIDVYTKVDGKVLQRGRAKFASQPQEAPIIHFDGPMTFDMAEPLPQLAPGTASEIRVRLVTKGFGEETVTWLASHDAIPADLHPVGEIEFPTSNSSEKPTRAKILLSERC